MTTAPRIAVLLCLVAALAPAAYGQGNVLLVIADDLGVDRIGAYGEHPDPGHTPVIDGLASQGMLFRNAWSNPVCSTSRATLLTGRYSFRTGVGLGIGYYTSTGFELPPDEVSLADLLAPSHRTLALGKWHLGSKFLSGLDHPVAMGFERHLGTASNIPAPPQTYFDFDKNVDGAFVPVTTYATTDTVDDAIAQIASYGSDPWFVWLAFNAPHAPFHKPPPALHTFALPPNVTDDIPLHVKAAIEAMDTELGRLLASIDPAVLDDTLIIFVGDNGTDRPATTAPFDPTHAKTTVYEPGINVPLIIKGPGVAAGAECDGLVNTTDVFATVAEAVGVAADAGTDSVSLVPYFSDPGRPSIRRWAYAEIFDANGYGPYVRWDRAMRDERYKLIRFGDDSGNPPLEELYDLQLDPFELDDLLDGPLSAGEQASYDDLTLGIDSQFEVWFNLAKSLGGTHGAPLLLGSGSLTGASPVSVSLSNALENATCFLLIGLDELNLPFSGGTMVPDWLTPGLLLIVPTDALGQVALSATWPAGIPPGFRVYLQAWIDDPGGPYGYAASNAVLGRTAF